MKEVIRTILRFIIAIFIVFCALNSLLVASISIDEISTKVDQSLATKGFNSKIENTNKTMPQATKRAQKQAPKAESLIGKLASNGYALVYFFDSTCPHCQRFSPIVRDVADRYGFKVYSFSFDNQSLPSFKHPAPVNRAIYNAYYGNVAPFYPVLILQNVNDMSFYVVSKGEMPEGLLIQQLNTFAKELIHV